MKQLTKLGQTIYLLLLFLLIFVTNESNTNSVTRDIQNNSSSNESVLFENSEDMDLDFNESNLTLTVVLANLDESQQLPKERVCHRIHQITHTS